MTPSCCLLSLLILSYVSGLDAAVTNATGDTDMATMISHMVVMEKTLTSLQSDLKSAYADIAALQYDLQKCPDAADFAKVKSEVESLKASYNSQQQLVTLNSNAPGEGVAFQVSQENLGASNWSLLNFNNVAYNAGNGYDKTSGIFTAPVNGTYFFWATIRFDTYANNYVFIYVGQKELASAFGRPYSKTDSRTVSLSAATFLAQGDQAHFQADMNADGSLSGHIHGYGESSYGGALLHAN